MTTRRTFLHGLGASALATLYPSAALGRPRPPTAALDSIGIQLYTLRDLMRQDVERTLAAVSEIGYREVEFAGYFDHTPAEVRGMLGRTGLSAPAAHVGFPEPGDAWNRVLDAAVEIGHRYVVTPWMSEEWRTAAGYTKATALFNRAGEAALARGLTFAYHNHEFEFEPVQGQRGFDILLEQTDPALVQIEMDLFWIVRGGAEPLAYFERYPGRFPLVHVKDMAADGAMVDVGQGRIDFRRIVRHATQAGIRHYFVEHDNPPDPLASARRSYEHLRAINP